MLVLGMMGKCYWTIEFYVCYNMRNSKTCIAIVDVQFIFLEMSPKPADLPVHLVCFVWRNECVSHWIRPSIVLFIEISYNKCYHTTKKPCLPQFLFSFISLHNNIFFWMATLQKKKSLKWELQSIIMNLF